jgi:hypothetical protein
VQIWTCEGIRADQLSAVCSGGGSEEYGEEAGEISGDEAASEAERTATREILIFSVAICGWIIIIKA